jgi:hypothetical protein
MLKKTARALGKKPPTGQDVVRTEASLRRIRNELSLLLTATDGALERIDHSKKEVERENGGIT